MVWITFRRVALKSPYCSATSALSILYTAIDFIVLQINERCERTSTCLPAPIRHPDIAEFLVTIVSTTRLSI